MNLFIRQLVLNCKAAQETLRFTGFNYYYGQMGAGKSTIARLIDFCLGGKLEYTPALQQEFVAATMEVEIEGKTLLLSRNSKENQIRAQWNEEGQAHEVLLPTRLSVGEVIEGTGIQLPSDLLFHLAGVRPPRVRGSAEASQGELGFGDLFKYCYLDQESMDSEFFGLESRQKSRDVIRLVVGWHHEKVLELEAQLDTVRKKRQRCEGGVEALNEALEFEHLPTPKEIEGQRQKIQRRIQELGDQIAAARQRAGELRPHIVEGLQARARALASRLADMDTALKGIEENVAKEKSHRNTLQSLATRQKRAESARAILAGVEFVQCPGCYENLPARGDGVCRVCGQAHGTEPPSTISDDTVQADIKARIEELDERIELQGREGERLHRQRQGLAAKKAALDQELNRALEQYDSAYLAAALEAETERARLTQQMSDLQPSESLSKKVEQQREEAARLSGQEAETRAKLKVARAEAQRDTVNLDLLKHLFRDCLIRSRLSGFREDDTVEMSAQDFLPHVYGSGSTKVYTSFSNIGSGGKKSFFKCCFAVAVHRLAARTGAIWPTLLLIDSPMKNISERENAEQFAGFHQLLYELAQTELKGTQFIIIDKEIFRPEQGHVLKFQERHMKPDDPMNPPLISYYRGQ
jgi:hypothetical protein